MKVIKKFIRTIIILIILIGCVTAGVDYLRMKNGLVPVFNQTEYSSRQKIQTYKGLFYKAQRKVLVSTQEPLEESSNLHFKFLFFETTIPSTWVEKKADSSLKVTPIKNCQEQSVLYYADQNVKVYTYCLDKIQIEQNQKKQDLITYLKKSSNILEEIKDQLSYGGILSDSSTEYFTNMDDYYADDIIMYQCHRNLVEDVYFAPKDSTFQMDFCTYKDDDFRFISEVLDETPEELEKNYQDLKAKKEQTEDHTGENAEKTEEITLPVPEVVFEDEKYRYEFSYPKSQYVFVTTPAVRGKVETKTPLMSIINNGSLTMDELIHKGLDINKIEKEKIDSP